LEELFQTEGTTVFKELGRGMSSYLQRKILIWDDLVWVMLVP
jgi:hypothetical protein